MSYEENSFEVLMGDGHSQGTFFAPVSTDAIASLVAQHHDLSKRIEDMAEAISRDTAVLHYFMDGNIDRESRGYKPNVAKLFDKSGAMACLHATYWRKAMELTNVYDLMPQKARDEWNKSIYEHTCPPFTDESARSTLEGLLASRGHFFAQRIDGVFRALSGDHVTNVPEGFGRRMIIANVLDQFAGVNHRPAGVINDLRCVIAKFMGRDEPGHSSTQEMLPRLKKNWGQWHAIDGGSLRIRLYKKGTAHLEVHPDMVWRLNGVLASLYPLAIPAKFRAKPTRLLREFGLIQQPLPFSVISALNRMSVMREKVGEDFRGPKFANIRNSLCFSFTASMTQEVKDWATRVLLSLGAVIQRMRHLEYFQFDYDPTTAIDQIVTSGCVPDAKSHQFYPTQEPLAKEVCEWATQGDDGQTSYLEPSAGTAGLAKFLPVDRTTCVEVSALHAKVLQAHGFNTVQGDFLVWKSGRQFDRVVMNPPFSDGRWQAHVEHAASMVAPHGCLCAILPASAKGKNWLPGFDLEYSNIREGEFLNTSVSVVIMYAVRRG